MRKQLVRDVCQCAVLDLGYGERGAVELARRSLGEVEDGSLYNGASQLSVNVAKCILIMLAHAAIAKWRYEMASCCRDFAPKRLELASLTAALELECGHGET